MPKKIQLPSGQAAVIKDPTVKGLRKFMGACRPFMSDDGEISDADMIAALFGEFVPLVAEAVGRDESQVDEMDPMDYELLAQEVIAQYRDFLQRMGERTNPNSAP